MITNLMTGLCTGLTATLVNAVNLSVYLPAVYDICATVSEFTKKTEILVFGFILVVVVASF